MAHRSRLSPLPRTLLMLILTLPLLTGPTVVAQEPPTKWQALGGPGGRLTHVVTAPGGRDVYAVSVVSVNRESDQTQWRDTGVLVRSDAIYLSNDAGATWQPVTNDLPPGEITALYVDHLGQLWTGIQDRTNLPDARNGLWHSEDRGASWREIPLERNDLIIRTITEDSRQELLVAAVDASGAEQGLIYRPANDGASWSEQRLSFPQTSSGRLARLVAQPAQSRVLFVLATNGELLRSSDGGQSWQPNAGDGTATAGSAQLSFSPDARDSGLLIQTQGTATSVKRSTDAGVTWSQLPVTGLPNSALVIRSMLALPRGVVLLNTEAGTYRSADSGRRWQPLEGVLSSGFVRAWASQGSDGQGVLAATDYGLFVSSDGGAIWRAYGTGLPANSGVAALLTQKDRPTLVASLRALGDADPPELLLTRDSGRDWLPADGGGSWSDATAWAIDPGNADNLFVAGRSFVAASKDGGFSWKVSQAETTARTAIAVAPSDSLRVYVDGAPCLRSEDGGQTWTKLPLQTEAGASGTATGLAVDPGDASHLWSGGVDGVRESRDAGNSWQRAGLDGQAVNWLAAAGGKSGEPLTVYAGLVDGGIMRRRATTADWQSAELGLPPRSVITAFAADPRTPGLLWAARDGGGVYRSTNSGDSWTNVGTGLGENLGLALAINFQAPGAVLLGTATAGVLTLGSNGPAAQATETPAGSATSVPGSQAGRSGVDARIEVLWPHNFASIDQAQLANIGIRLFVPRSLQSPACGWQPKVQLWQAVDSEPAVLVEAADQRSLDGQPFPYWEANDVDVSAARDGTRKIYFMVAVQGVETATSVWAHAADARTYFPEQEVPSGVASGTVDAVDARIQIVWPHDEAGAEASVENAKLANVAVTLFKHGTRLSVADGWPGKVRLYGAWNSEVARPLATEAAVGVRQAGVITYPVWEFNDLPVDRAMDKTNKLYLWAVAEGVKSYPTLWAHGADARTFFPQKDEPIQGCLP